MCFKWTKVMTHNSAKRGTIKRHLDILVTQRVMLLFPRNRVFTHVTNCNKLQVHGLAFLKHCDAVLHIYFHAIQVLLFVPESLIQILKRRDVFPKSFRIIFFQIHTYAFYTHHEQMKLGLDSHRLFATYRLLSRLFCNVYFCFILVKHFENSVF